jgi:putative ABC transport system substrate-binding protein
MHPLAWAVVVFLLPLLVYAQPSAKLQRIGVIHPGGTFEAMVEGLRSGLKEAGLTERKHFVLHLRDTKGNAREVAGAAAKQLESEEIDLLVAFTTTIALRAKQATRAVPIVFYAGDDPVRLGLVKSFAKPADRLTGVHYFSLGLTDKRMEILHRVLPKARRVVGFYQRAPTARTSGSVALARQGAGKLGIELIERQFSSIDDLLAQVRALRPGEMDAILSLGDAMATSALPSVVGLARERKLPLIAAELNLVDAGALASYGASYFDLGHAVAKPARLVLAGTRPHDIPVEIYDRVELALNLRVAKELGITVPEPVILRADRVIR